MAISRHDPEWKRVVFMALAGGVHFHRTIGKYGQPQVMYQKPTWYAYLPDLNAVSVRGFSKIEAARAALRLMGVDENLLPDAAKSRPGAPGKK